ncbi:hypothetical protein [Alcaligenes faecalis]|jgi:hypothetical protein|uniref:Uncharacterized protein n=1 Tax=Alcaligenes faecalis TaxID=511 RepID=A0A2U2BIH6_ALCFA|nr:hypothetical protein [Alcaligenes faecalis]OSZ44542.1 hypothetical protein BVZ30_07630 [Alcaligenes faecalis]OSZ50386.1 hypothetical protein BVZ31_08685 [Alcaligenes faecalis]OSZ52477.1 hypothetical protein BVZ32_11945 [Alcaligenes faecalis]PWE13810.1 hypothetical protein DF183_11615 [Alcaligenes faecalis]
MLFSRPHDSLQRALRMAVATYRPAAVCDLLASHGTLAFARALPELSARVRADVLAMLSEFDRNQVYSAMHTGVRVGNLGRRRTHGPSPSLFTLFPHRYGTQDWLREYRQPQRS